MKTVSSRSLAGFVFSVGCVVFLLFIIHSPTPGSTGTNNLTITGRMHELRASHTATLLPDGRVLIVGGFKKVRVYDQQYFNSAETYDPETKMFTPAGTLHAGRCGHTATLLQNGKVLIVGGTSEHPLASAELYDPGTATFTLVGSMAVTREGHTATLLKNGDVLVTGGCGENQPGAELFNAGTQHFEPAGKMIAQRAGHTATLLPDGKVLLTGGTNRFRRDHKVSATAEIYHPNTGRFEATGSMTMVRYKHAALLLPDGNVLIVGGSDERDWQGQYNSAELYDTKLGAFSRLPDMQAKRFKLPHGIALQANGNALVSGGSGKIEVYDAKRKTFSAVAEFEEPHFYQTATLLKNGDVLIAGGYNTKPQSTDMAWIFRR